MIENDFGFSLANEEDITIDSKQSAQEIYNLIRPLLDRLSKNPEMNVIKWNGEKRVEAISSVMEKMKHILNRETK